MQDARNPNGFLTRGEFYEEMVNLRDFIVLNNTKLRDKSESDDKELDKKIQKNTDRYYNIRNWGSIIGAIATVLSTYLGVNN